MGVAAEFNAHGRIVRARRASDDGCRAESGGKTIRPRELVETTENLCDKGAYDKNGEDSKRETMGVRPKTFFDGANGAFDFANMTVGCYDVDIDGGQGAAKVTELVVAMNVNDLETASGVEVNDCGRQREWQCKNQCYVKWYEGSNDSWLI